MEKEISTITRNESEELILSMSGMYEDRSVKVVCENQELAKVTLSRNPKLARNILRDAGEGATAETKAVELIIKKFGTDYKFIS